MIKILSYFEQGKRVVIRSRTKLPKMHLSQAERIRISKAMRRWARNNRSTIRQRYKAWKGKRLSSEHRRRIGQAIRRRLRR